VLAARPDAAVEVCALSDGGDGFGDAIARALGAEARPARVTGPLGEPVEARWFLGGDGTALVESAAAAGLALVPPQVRRPTETTTFGVGELVRAALDGGARRVVVGLGGTATTDGGAGLAQALGVVLKGAATPVRGGELERVTGVDRSSRDPRLADVPLVVLTDVDNPLTGPEGTARIYGPQKGASEAEVLALDRALLHFAKVAGDAGEVPGDGAAGGMGYALRVLFGAERRRGIDWVLDAVRFDERLDGVDVVFTGEGRLDAQSARGKVLSGVAARASARGIPVVALVGSLGDGAGDLASWGLTRVLALTGEGVTEAYAMLHAEALLETLAADAVRGVRQGGG
jgi:glycerate kinase